jgi:uncharacterized membrane protein
MRFALFALIALLVVIVLQVAYYAPKLPDTVASHFGPSGQADGWSSKTTFLALYGGVVVITIGPILLLPWLLRYIPDDLINMPHKEYWLAPERREETLRTVGVYLLWIGVGTLMLISHLMGETFATNLEPEPHLRDTFWWALGLYLAFVAVWCVVFVRHFRRPGESSTSG